MKSLVLIQPPARGRISGGFLYNARMAEGGSWKLIDASVDEVPGLLRRLGEGASILMDSIWLTPEHAPLFLDSRRRGGRLGLMLHSFPSMIEATESGQPPRRQPTTFERELIEQLDVVVVPGGHYADMLSGTRTPLIVAEPGIDDVWRAQPRRRTGPCRLVSVGGVTPRKGFLDVAEVLSRRCEHDYSWSVAGSLDVDAGYVARVRERAQELPVTFCGQLSPGETRALVQRSDVLLMPSYDENQPLVVLEAMAASVPVVAYAAGATRDMLEHGREGFISEIGDRHALAEHVQRLIEHEDLRHEMALACWDRQRSLRNWAAAALHASARLEPLLASAV
jgi:glycosyltransferase involved in cell wall biosynthesis